jgi:hypothetical protein
MIDPFEYEQTRTVARVNKNVTDGKLDDSLVDRPLQKLNNFDKVSEFEHYLVEKKPFTDAYEKRVGRVGGRDNHKSDFQSEAIGQLGSMSSGYEVTPSVDVMVRPNASSLIGSYLDKSVGFVPNMMDTVHPIDNLNVDEPVLQPGITFIDSRKNMATRLQ